MAMGSVMLMLVFVAGRALPTIVQPVGEGQIARGLDFVDLVCHCVLQAKVNVWPDRGLPIESRAAPAAGAPGR